MYQQWTPPQRSRRELRQMALKRRALKRRFWQFSASVCLFSFLFVQKEGLDYGHISPYLPTEITEPFAKARALVTEELAFVQRVFLPERGATEENQETNGESSVALERLEGEGETSKETGEEITEEIKDVSVEETYQESLTIFASQGNQLWTDMLELVEGGSGQKVLQEISEEVSEEILDEEFPVSDELEKEIQEEVLWETIFEVGEVLEYRESALPESHTENYIYLGEGETASPVDNVVTSAFGLRTHPLTGEPAIHNGVDLRSGEGVSITAWREGVVSVVGHTSIVGNYLRIDHGEDIYSFYAHCSEILVEKGQTVSCGEEIAKVGATGNVTGPHLHFEITYEGVYLNPLHYIEHRGILE